MRNGNIVIYFQVCVYSRNLFPDNLFEATFQKSQTKTYPMKTKELNSTNSTVVERIVKYVGKTDGTNLLGKTVKALPFFYL